MKNYKAFVLLVVTATLLQACWSTRNYSTSSDKTKDTTGIAFNTSGINRSVPPPVNQNQPLGSVGMGPTNSIPPAKPVSIASENIMENDLSPSRLNDRTVTNFSYQNLTSKEFFKEISHSYANMITIGQLAQQRADNKSIKALGNDMSNYFQQSGKELKSIASNQGYVTSNTRVDNMILNNLKEQNGLSFDKLFIQTTLNSLQGFIALYERTSITDDYALKNYALKNIPNLKEYLAKTLSIKEVTDNSK